MGVPQHLSDPFYDMALVDCVWIFGYGSLMWKPPQDMHYLRMTLAKLSGYHRFFWQLSPDHRGTEENPGRVVTLTDQCQKSNCHDCWGVAYQIPKEDWETHLEALDHRERTGYERRTVRISIWNSKTMNTKRMWDYSRETTPFSEVDAVIYYAGDNNEYYSEIEDQTAEHQKVAGQLLFNFGNSGRNIEYFAKVYLFELLMSNQQKQTLDLYQLVHEEHQQLRLRDEKEAKIVDECFTLPPHLRSMIQEYLSDNHLPCELTR